MKRLLPGVYDDGDGGLHLDMGEMLRAAGVLDTPENRDELARHAERIFADTGLVVEVDPK